MTVVDQLMDGLRITCDDGAVVVCKPLSLADAITITKLWRQRFAPFPPKPNGDSTSATALADWEAASRQVAADRTVARLAIAEKFAELYPQLAPHISAGDLEGDPERQKDGLLADFFWAVTGAKLVTPEMVLPSTGTPGSASTPPPSDTSPS